MTLEVSGFWRRSGAFFIDCVVLGSIGLLLGAFFTAQFVALAGWGRLIGFGIAAIYFTLLNSRVGNGQTIGKRLLKIRVVGQRGDELALPKSFLRFTIVAAPWFLNGAILPAEYLPAFVFSGLTLLVFGFGFSIIYLFLCNRHTRQSFHDLLLGTFVVRVDPENPSPLKPVWRVHYVVCGILLLVSLSIPFVTSMLISRDVLTDLTKTREALQDHPMVLFATLFDGSSFFAKGGSGTSNARYLSARALLREAQVENQALAVDLARRILGTYPNAQDRDAIQVALIYGYDIGIASFWRKKAYSQSPQKWIETLAQNRSK